MAIIFRQTPYGFKAHLQTFQTSQASSKWLGSIVAVKGEDLSGPALATSQKHQQGDLY